jgi:type VII secretion effector (TIGR04197 family)
MSRMIINHGNANARANEIIGSVNGLEARALSPIDSMTTLTANSISQETFDIAQRSLASFSSAVSGSGNAIVSVSEAFRAVDRL